MKIRLETLLQLTCVGLIIFASLMIALDGPEQKKVTVSTAVDYE